MEALVSIGLIACGAVIGVVATTVIFEKRYADVLDDMYERGRADGQKEAYN